MSARAMQFWRIVLLALAALTLSGAASAQFFRGFGGARVAKPADFDGRFHVCLMFYQGSRNGAGGSWTTDFPRADINVSIRLSELTRTNVSFSSRGAPNHLVVRLTDETLFQCPFLLMSAPGSAFFSDTEAAQLRLYLQKGGFLWADDFWGSYQWEQWVSQLRKVLPEAQHPIVDLPGDHPLFRTQFTVPEVPQIPNIGFFMRSGGGTSEQGADSAVPHARGIVNERGHVMVFMTHNTDISDSWEREGDDPTYFITFGPRGYALGINVLLYSMTH